MHTLLRSGRELIADNMASELARLNIDLNDKERLLASFSPRVSSYPTLKAEIRNIKERIRALTKENSGVK